MRAQDMMKSKSKKILIAIVIVAIGGLFSCSDEAPPAPQTQVVKKKIEEQKKGAGSKASVKKSKSGSNDAGGGKDNLPTETTNPATTSKLVKESMAFTSSYNPKGRFDPFEPLLKNDPVKPVTLSKGRKKRVPQTPLERVAISQLKLSAIMRSRKGNSAIVEDATGKGYVIRKGTFIGLNSGQVIQIDKSSVKIEEEIEDVSGEFRIQNIELKLQKPAGEL